VNSHNVLISDAVDGGRFWANENAEDVSRVRFWLIDFGLAVDSQTWPNVWQTADVAGDCRYWPPSSFFMTFYGPQEMQSNSNMCEQYKTRLDVAGLGLTALELLCSTALASSWNWGPDDLRGSWRRLFEAYKKYRDDVTRWHQMIFQVYSSKGETDPLYQKLNQEHIVDRVAAHVDTVRSLLRSCTRRVEDVQTQRLLHVLADMIDETKPMGMGDVVPALNVPSTRQHVEPVFTAQDSGPLPKLNWPAAASGKITSPAFSPHHPRHAMQGGA